MTDRPVPAASPRAVSVCSCCCRSCRRPLQPLQVERAAAARRTSSGSRTTQTALGSDTFRTAVGNNVLIVVLSLALQIPFSLGLAVLLNRRFPGRAIFRLIFFLPYVLSEAITGIVFTPACSSRMRSWTRA